MRYHADLHIHSKHSRATSRDCDLEHLARWALRKGVTVVGTGDFTHPGWRVELRERLVPAEPGLWRLRPDLERAVSADLPPACRGAVRFQLSVEISTIYKKGDATRKVHHLVFAPDLEAVDQICARLARIGNLSADGRPILGLDSRDLLEIVLEVGRGCYLVPAHIWTPWFAALGSKSGFDSIDDCYGDLASHIFAVETGLSSDPPMNWRVSSLDRFRLISSSDAHSPPKIGREALTVDTELDYFSLRRALETGEGYAGTVEFFPEEGKYHLDGHRACGVRLEPEESRARAGLCPDCGRPLTLGVLHRVCALADRAEGATPEDAAPFASLVPLPEVLGELAGAGPDTRGVARLYDGLLGRLGPEIPLLTEAPLEDVARAGSSLLAEAMRRLRRGEVRREAGYDGEYGRIHLFAPDELRSRTQAAFGFDLPAPPPAPATSPRAAPAPAPAPLAAPAPPSPSTGPDAEQRAAIEAPLGSALILAGPGTGKTTTLLARVAHVIQAHGVPPEAVLAVTFTRKAAEELRARLGARLGEAAAAVQVSTLHALAAAILQEHGHRGGVHRGFRVIDEAERAALLVEATGLGARQVEASLAELSRCRRMDEPVPPPLVPMAEALELALSRAHALGFEDLLHAATALIEQDAELRALLAARHRFVAVDEFQDTDRAQYRLLRALTPEQVWAIGDPDQSIYGFRGGDPTLFDRCLLDWSDVSVFSLTWNYRSPANVVSLADAVIRAAPGRPARQIRATRPAGPELTVRVCADERAEARWIVAEIERALGGHTLLSADPAHPGDLSFGDVAVLVRTSAQAEPIAAALGESGIPFQRRDQRPLLELPGVRGLVSSAELDAALAARSPLADALRDAARAGGAEAAEALIRLLPVAARAGDDPARFWTELSLAVDLDAWDPRAEAVSLLTLHAAKGLEFRAVFLAGCEDGLMPLRFGARCADLEEERRLFYVGLTRTRGALALSRAARRDGRARDLTPFLSALGLPERHDEERRRNGRQLSLWSDSSGGLSGQREQTK